MTTPPYLQPCNLLLFWYNITSILALSENILVLGECWNHLVALFPPCPLPHTPPLDQVINHLFLHLGLQIFLELLMELLGGGYYMFLRELSGGIGPR